MAKQKKDESVDFLDHFIRLMRLLPSTDLTLIVLKGHLLIEERLISMVKAKLKHGAALKKRGRFHFFQWACLAEAMYYDSSNSWIWTSIKKLNEVRNHLGHDAEAAELSTRAVDFIDSLQDFRDDGSAKIEERMRSGLVFLCGAMAHFGTADI